MLALTPSERRGALTVALILLIGTGWDLVRAYTMPPVPAAKRLADTLNSSPPVADDSGSAAAPRVAPPDSGTRLDLNRASAAELDELPGIGPVLAARIVAHREQHGAFRSVDELLAVPGIGPALFARLAPRVRAGPPSVQPGRARRASRT